MNTVVVRCAGCFQLSRVTAEAVGLEVACPRCAFAFVAVPESPDDPPVVRRAAVNPVPLIQPRSPSSRPIIWDEPEPDSPDVERVSPTGGLVALALLPFGIPLLWLLVSALTQREVVWSFAVPLALAVGASGLAFGIAYVSRWSIASRVKAILGLLLLAYLTTGVLFVVKKSWLQDMRRVAPRAQQDWRSFNAAPSRKPLIRGYTIQLPRGLDVIETESPLPGEWKAYECRDSRRAEVFWAAAGRLTKQPADNSPQFWEQMGIVVRGIAPPESEAKEEKIDLRETLERPQILGREYHLTRPDDLLWCRVVRVYVVQGQVIYLHIEGPQLTPDSPDVVKFLNSLTGPFVKAD